MPSTVLVGAQWGDEGKGKIVDHLAGRATMVVRSQGGNNAGHTVIIGDMVLKLHHVPAGITRPEVAAVGARLLYPSACPQHEGVVIGVGGGSCLNVDTRDYFGLGRLVRNVSAVTAACMMARRQVFEQLGCFDEGLKVAFHDVDYCLRAREKGYLVVYTPYAALFHHESASRGNYHPQEDELFYRNRWGNPGEYRDPYYNPNLSLSLPFTVRVD